MGHAAGAARVSCTVQCVVDRLTELYLGLIQYYSTDAIQYCQSSYLSQISQIIFVEKKISCGEILGRFGKFWRNFGKFWEFFGNFWRFCHNLRAFAWRKIEPKKYIWGYKICGLDMEGQLSNDGRSCERQSGCSSSAEYSNQSCLILSGTHNSNPLF